MKTLYLVRHAKSSWDNPDLPDYDRPLNQRGLRDAPEIGRRLALMKTYVEVMLSSPANRAYTTASIIALILNYPQMDIATDEAIYHADRSELVDVLKKQDPGISTLMLYGHNPGLTDLANYLAGADIDNIPTCGVVAIQLQIIDWSSITKNSGKVLFFEYPKKNFQGKFLS